MTKPTPRERVLENIRKSMARISVDSSTWQHPLPETPVKVHKHEPEWTQEQQDAYNDLLAQLPSIFKKSEFEKAWEQLERCFGDRIEKMLEPPCLPANDELIYGL